MIPDRFCRRTDCRTGKGPKVPDGHFFIQRAHMMQEGRIGRLAACRDVKTQRAHREKTLGESKRSCFKAVIPDFLVLGTPFHLQKLSRTPRIFCLHELHLYLLLKIKTDIYVIYFKKNKSINVNKTK